MVVMAVLYSILILPRKWPEVHFFETIHSKYHLSHSSDKTLVHYPGGIVYPLYPSIPLPMPLKTLTLPRGKGFWRVGVRVAKKYPRVTLPFSNGSTNSGSNSGLR